MRESRKPPSFWKERSPESSDILRAFIICYACSGHAQAPSSSQSFSGHAQAPSSSQSFSGHAQALSSTLSFSGHARFCHPRCHSLVMSDSVILAVILWSCKVLSSSQSFSGHAQTLSSLQSFSGHAMFCQPRCQSYPSFTLPLLRYIADYCIGHLCLLTRGGHVFL